MVDENSELVESTAPEGIPNDQIPVGISEKNEEVVVEPPKEAPKADPLTMKSLLEAGTHFGHQTHRWDPKMKRHIFAERNGIHIIDLQQTMVLIQHAAKFVAEVTATGKKILMVGTKRQAQDIVKEEAIRSGQYYCNQRWLGGTMTNFDTIQTRIEYLINLEESKAKNEWRRLPKKEALKLDNQAEKMNRYLGGIKEMTSIPGALFIVDIGKEKIAVAEARRLGVPIVAVVDTDCDPDLVDYVIPGNDDAMRSIRLVAAQIAQAAIRGNQEWLSRQAESGIFDEEPETITPVSV